jgi:hypothetical protein
MFVIATAQVFSYNETLEEKVIAWLAMKQQVQVLSQPRDSIRQRENPLPVDHTKSQKRNLQQEANITLEKRAVTLILSQRLPLRLTEI